jgi:hypothetical protein
MGKGLFSIISRPDLSPTHPPVQWILGAVSPGVMQQRHETDCLPPSSAEVNGGAVLPLPVCFYGVVFI